LIRRKDGGEAFALTTQLIKKSDGTKFGKTESGAIWLDSQKTSPYKFYQFWLNASDVDVKSWIRIFTLLGKTEIESLEIEHDAAPHLRVLQKALAKDITIRVHGDTAYKTAVEASNILFGASTADDLNKLDEETFLDVFEGVPQSTIAKAELEVGMNIVELLSDKTHIFPSRGEARKMVIGGGVSINKQKMDNPESFLNNSHLLNGKYILAQKGKKNYYLIIAQ
jgi:tyrosyl-tRNA synthetase